MEGFFLYPVSYDRQQRDSPGSIYLSNQSYYSPCANKQTTPGLEDKTQRGNNVANPTPLFPKYPYRHSIFLVVVGCLYGLGVKVAQKGLQAGFEPMVCFWLMSEQI